MSKNKKKSSSADQFTADLITRMDSCPDAESMNNNILIPFAKALEDVCQARGYIMNIYGDKSNIVFTNEEDAEVIYQMVEAYLDNKDTDES